MKLQLAAKGTVTECRNALNEVITKLQPPHRQEHAVVRSIAHFIVEENLDPLQNGWQEQVNALRGAGIDAKKLPAEPQTSFSIDLTINVEELARGE